MKSHLNKVLHYVALTTLLLALIGCSSTSKKLDEPSSTPVQDTISDEAKVFDLESYNKAEDFFVNDKKHFEAFLDKYFDKIELKEKHSKQYYLDNFQERPLKRQFVQWAHDSMQSFNDKKLQKYDGKLFSYYYQNRGKEKTIFYSHGNVSPLMYWADFAVNFLEYFSDYNVVFVHSTRINSSLETFSAAELNKIFEDDTKGFLSQTGFQKTQNYFNIVCHSALFTYDFFKNNPGLYKEIIYYAPMIRKDKNDVVQDLAKIVDPKAKIDEFHTIFYFYSLSTPKGTRTFPIPKVSRDFNIDMEKNLTTLYFQGLDISIFDRKSLIYAERESMLANGSYSMKDFKKNRIAKLANMSHHDYFSVRDRYSIYFDTLKNAINKSK